MKTLHCKLAVLLLLLFLLTGCFSPLDYKGSGDTTLRVSLPGGTAGARTAVTPEDLRYELHFSGPGGRTVTATAVYGETVTVNVVPGTWTVSVWAYDSVGIPKAVGEAYNIDVKAGKENNVPMKMAVYTEVSTWADLATAITTGTYDEFIVLKGDITGFTGSTITISNKKITLAATVDATITPASFTGSFFDITNNGSLVMGFASPEYKNNQLTFNGNSVATSFVTVTSGSFTMNSGTIKQFVIVVVVTNMGRFLLNGGLITNNNSGVDNQGFFTMTGGAIFDNFDGAANLTSGVYNRYQATFIMSGGTISNNVEPWGITGGVRNWGNFTMSGTALIEVAEKVPMTHNK